MRGVFVSEDSLEYLSRLFCGDLDNSLYVYKSGPILVNFFNTYFGYKDIYGSHFPSRWAYTLQKIEEIVNSYEGIKQSFAVQAGREVRVIVESDRFDDVASQKLARDIARKVEDELEFPGQIRVTVVREFRATEIAK